MAFDKQDQKAAHIRFGLRVRRRREALGMNEAELGKRIGLRASQVRTYEQGRRIVRASLVIAFAKALDIPAADLLDGKEITVRSGIDACSPIRAVQMADLATLDIHIGLRLRERRKVLGFSQERLGRKLEISFQQIQKYENGKNSLSTRRLYQLMHILDVPITYFFDDYAGSDSSKARSHPSNDLNLALVRACERIASPKVKAAVTTFIKAIAKKYVSDDA